MCVSVGYVIFCGERKENKESWTLKGFGKCVFLCGWVLVCVCFFRYARVCVFVP